MEIKLIACDMDGTLLHSDGLTLSARNKAAVRRALAAGKIFLLATGRMYLGALAAARELELDIPVICYNGALVRGSVSGSILYEQPLRQETAQALLDFCRQRGLYVQAYFGDACYVERETAFSRYYGRINGVTVEAVGEAVYKADSAPYKLLVVTEDKDFERVMAALEQEFAGRADLYLSQRNFIEVMEPGVNKWAAVKSVAASYGVEPREIMCIGDSNNDVSMVAGAGLGVAMGNATEGVRQAARIVTACNDDDGVALVLESILTEQAVEA